MSKKRGLSMEEKKTRMLQIFYENKEFYQLKELEKIAPKSKGIISQSVKEVIQILVDDHFVTTEKIGTSVYFWAFASNAKHNLKRKLEQLETGSEECDRKYEEVTKAIDSETIGREESQQRELLLEKLEKIRKKENTLRDELQKYRDSDPEYMKQLNDEIQGIKDGINCWTENIYTIKSYCKEKFNMEEADINQSFNIPNELEFVL